MGVKGVERCYQPLMEGMFPEEKKDETFFIPAGTTIFFQDAYIDSYNCGDLREGIEAKKTGTKIKGLEGYTSVGVIELIYNCAYTKIWTMGPGTRFGVYAKNVKPLHNSTR